MNVVDILKAIDKLDVTKNYQPLNGLTHCNQFDTDLCKELKVELLWDLANKQFMWLDTMPAVKAGWSPCSRADAQTYANKGRLVVPAYYNEAPAPNNHGHIAVVHPITAQQFVREPYIHITQAGRENFVCGSLARGFGFKPVKFWSNAGPQ